MSLPDYAMGKDVAEAYVRVCKNAIYWHQRCIKVETELKELNENRNNKST